MVRLKRFVWMIFWGLIVVGSVLSLMSLAFAERPDLQISPTSKPNASQFGLIRAYIAKPNPYHQWTQAEINACVGQNPATLGKDMEGYTQKLIECISALP